jgi:AcrR family transcriptional regulator
VTRRRVRRDPAAARDLILTAAERLFAERGPDRVGLKEVARAAGVSQPLVSHYFGTYDALVEAALERRGVALRQALVASLAAAAGELDLKRLLVEIGRAMADPAAIRLGVWAFLSGRAEAANFFPTRHQGLRLIAEALRARHAQTRKRRAPAKDYELVVAVAMATLIGWTVAKPALLAGLGRRVTPAADDDFVSRLAALLEQHLDRAALP